MAFADYTVLTPERVSLKYDIAGIGSRGAAAIVDTVLQLGAILVIVLALSSMYVTAAAFLPVFHGDGAGVLLVGLLSVGILLVTGGYFMLFEIVWNGQTPGKRLVGLRVIRENGYPLRPVDAVIRNLVRIVDWLPGIYGVGVLTMLFNPRSRRVGDFASGTIVVREGSTGADLVFGPAPSEQHAYTLSNADATLVRDFLLRRTKLNAAARAELASRLAVSIGSRYGLPVEVEPEAFLQQLAA
jgi:uncharacterized RDD family membrane protein YckC